MTLPDEDGRTGHVETDASSTVPHKQHCVAALDPGYEEQANSTSHPRCSVKLLFFLGTERNSADLFLLLYLLFAMLLYSCAGDVLLLLCNSGALYIQTLPA